jgi:hypothetical protein
MGTFDGVDILKKKHWINYGFKVQEKSSKGHLCSPFVLSFALFVTGISAKADSYRDLYADTWAAADALGRQLPGYEECGPLKENKKVGIFYFLWLGQHSKDGPYDITRLLKENPENPSWGPVGNFHHWGRPELGYYTSDSVYVIRKHLRLLSDAGIDVLIFDVTNTYTYPNIYSIICEEMTNLRSGGQHTPQIMFLTHSQAGATITTLYRDFYSQNRYPDLWFYWKGKPLILGKSSELDSEIRNFFTMRDCWAWTHRRDTWQWLDHWPQQFGWHESPDKPEELSVCAAEHPISNIGRSHYRGKQPPTNYYGVASQTDRGLYFQQQWERALEADPEFIFITGWNEWAAQRFLKEEGQPPAEMAGRPLRPGDTYFVDAYTQEYSRDIEPMEGGHGDNYYYQMVAGIRRYKGVRPPPPVSAKKTISVDGEFDDWGDVTPEYRDHVGDVEHRRETGWGNAGMYVNMTGRNDFVTMKAARDDQNLYFYAQTSQPITPHTDSNWMLLFLDTDQDFRTGWHGYDFVVNLTVRDNTRTSLHSLASGWNPQPAGWIPYAARGRCLELSIPRELAGCKAGDVKLDFHWADNLQKLGDIEEFALNGDSAPERRFNYRYASSELDGLK